MQVHADALQWNADTMQWLSLQVVLQMLVAPLGVVRALKRSGHVLYSFGT